MCALIYVTSPPLESRQLVVVVTTVLMLLSAAASASVFSVMRTDPSQYHRVLFGAVVTTWFMHVVVTLSHIFLVGLSGLWSTGPGTFVHAVHLLTTGVLFLGAVSLAGREGDALGLAETGRAAAVSTGTGILVLSVFYGLYVSGLLPDWTGQVSTVVALSGVVVFVLVAVGAYRQQYADQLTDPLRLSVAALLFALSSLMVALATLVEAGLWVFTMGLEAGALMVVIIATCYPLLRSVGIRPLFAYGVVLMFPLLVVAPFIGSYLMAALLGLQSVVNPVLTISIHLSSAMMATVVGLLLVTEASDRTSWSYSPVAFALFSWSVLDVATALEHFHPFYGPLGEAIVPYVVGGLVTVVALGVAIRRLLRPPADRSASTSGHAQWYGYVFVVVAVVLGEAVYDYLTVAVPGIVTHPIGDALLVFLGTVAVFELAYLLTLLAIESGEKVAVGMSAAGSLMIWIVSLTLRGNYVPWTIGWWSAEVVLAVPTLMLPFLLLLFYSTRSMTSQRFLSHVSAATAMVATTISREHAAASDELYELTNRGDLGKEPMERVLRALTHLSSADELTQMMVTLVRTERFSPDELEDFDVIAMFNHAIGALAAAVPDIRSIVMVDGTVGTYFARATPLLQRLFFHLLRAVIRRIEPGTGINLSAIGPADRTSPHTIDIRLTVVTTVSQAEQLRELFQRYFCAERVQDLDIAVARRLTTLYGGRVTVLEEAEELELTNMTVLVSLPAA